jgi:hypothetical protein
MLTNPFVTPASMLQVTVLLLLILIVWLVLLLFALALCRGVASADKQAITASAKRPPIPERPIHSVARPRTVAVRACHEAPRRYYSTGRARRGGQHASRVS